MAYLDDPVVKELAYALELAFGDVEEDEEWEEAFDLVGSQWRDIPRQGLAIGAAWREILARGDGELAAYLVQSWANQGTYSGEQALRLLREWYQRLEPTWKAVAD